MNQRPVTPSPFNLSVAQNIIEKMPVKERELDISKFLSKFKEIVELVKAEKHPIYTKDFLIDLLFGNIEVFAGQNSALHEQCTLMAEAYNFSADTHNAYVKEMESYCAELEKENEELREKGLTEAMWVNPNLKEVLYGNRV